MPGSPTTPGRPSACAGALRRLAFRYTDSVGTQNQFSIAAPWLACTYPCRRFADTLTDACARLGADVVRYSFIAGDSHPLLLAGLPAHLCENALTIDILAPRLHCGVAMKRYVEGDDRSQSTLFPERLDDYIAEDNPVRAIEVFVEELDLGRLGFEGMQPEATGRPAYHPATLLKIYIYGYLNRIQSSRRLERETQRNVELIWLTGRLMPDFKTIADFRKDNGKAIRNVCREFIVLCRQLNLFSEAIVAIDGSKFKAVNNRDKNFTDAKLKKRMEQLEESIGRYLAELDRADREPAAVTEGKVSRLKEKVAAVKAQMQRLNQIGRNYGKHPIEQVSLTDPDARSMATSGRGTGIVGYNVQTAVDTKHHLIVAHEVTNLGHDRTQLFSMATQARSATGTEELTVLADRGYFKGEEILDCEQAGMTTAGAQAADLQQQGRRSVRQARLCLHRRGR